MSRTYRLVLALVFVVAIFSGALQAHFERTRAVSDLKAKLDALSLGLQEVVVNYISEKRYAKLNQALKQFGNPDHEKHVASAVVCSGGRIVAISRGSEAWSASCADPSVVKAESEGIPVSWNTSQAGRSYFVTARKVEAEVTPTLGRPYSLVVAHSLDKVEAETREAFLRAVAIALVAGLATVLLFKFATHWILIRSMRFLVRWTRNIFAVAFQDRLEQPMPRLREVNRRLPAEFKELTKELSALALKMRHERMRLVWSAENQSLLQSDDQTDGLRTRVQEVLKGRKLVIIANRQPYSHENKNGHVEVVRPASGVVSALEPIMRVCGGGVWVGHGSGSADRESVDVNNEVQVPPEHPTYTLRRVWLSKEEENGYYYGFSNEGLWPLCHLAYTRPTFRLGDWEMYKAVNQKFAEATLKEIDPAQSVILVQDYHYAILPKMLRDRAPDATIELFWHIPWPNPEAFGICPQYKELLEGMLGADVVGFHTQFHCNNFLETCDRFLECRVDWERFSVTIGNRETLIRSYPISIATEPVPQISSAEKTALRSRYGITAPFIALGVDRLDYTKGLVERMAGVERFLEKYPEFIGKFSFVEMGTPSRTNIPSYQLLISEVEGAIERVNKRFGREGYTPIVLLKGHFDWNEVAEFYQLGQACLVTSLHDGMNLVAKEYVWSQAADEGTLILSRFTGAARELSEALIVNPYSSEEIADALYEAMTMSREERHTRMSRMKEKVQSHNAFHWATDLLAGVNAKA